MNKDVLLEQLSAAIQPRPFTIDGEGERFGVGATSLPRTFPLESTGPEAVFCPKLVVTPGIYRPVMNLSVGMHRLN